ncbi:hypothetical protein GF359_10210 [candidate division WOR-3 bacterium]|uniref:Uncharacterized protein n=1 Tax=candidate division WOR-3 bacterium TaxID=2052148 RepID=A0A9D5KB08_UNCW3|nr:hypothetical protein [candidate division WOR-3 bacterium]MBD3365573.1 hypothetical protein [candidate division WOR-3 bacterium]
MRKRKEQQERRLKPNHLAIDSVFGPRPKCRGIILQSRWSFEGDDLVLSYSPLRERYPWSRKGFRLPRFYTRHGAKGENRTNNCASKTRHGSAAELRFLKSLATPDLCFMYYFSSREDSDDGGGSDIRLHGASGSGRAVSCIYDLDTEFRYRGYFITDAILNRPKGMSVYNHLKTKDRGRESFRQWLPGGFNDI